MAETEQPLWTIQSILQWMQQHFQTKGLATPRLDAELLLAEVCHCRRLDLYLNFDKPLTQAERDQLRGLVRQRAAGTPVAYLLERQEFWSLTLKVRPGVLIPRPDTETLIEVALEQIRLWQTHHSGQRCQIVELGTGTAAIPLALCSELKDLDVWSVDLSPLALAVAQENLQEHEALQTPRGNRLQLLRGDKLEMFPSETFDFLLSNPPYIPHEHLDTLQPEVALYEPRLALDGGTDGLDFYRYLLMQGQAVLKPQGQALFEIGFDQTEAVSALTSADCTFVRMQKDLAGNPRVVQFQRS